MNKLLEKISGSWLFLLIVVAMYVVTAVFEFSVVEKALQEFYTVFIKIIPVFVLVFVLMFFSNYLLTAKSIGKILGEKAGVKGWFVAVIGGIISSGPIYMWYPLLSDLKEKGMKDAFVAAFLYNRAVKIPMLPIMVLYFGLSFTIVLSVYMVIFSIINGVLVEKLLKVTFFK